jgi:hypothetical protein
MLLVHEQADPTSRFSHYLRELLAIEGFAMIDEITRDTLGQRLVPGARGVVLPRMQLPLDLADEMAGWVHGGGRLVALHPDNALLKRLGFVPGYVHVTDGVLSFPETDLFAGLPLDPVQAIVPVSVFSAGPDIDATVLATVAAPGDPFTATPAIWHARVGAGEVILFGFDLAKAVARLRHGDPDLADMPNEIFDRIQRPSDLFRGQIDPRQATVPQADILTAVLGRAVGSLLPQPRFWYYPEASQRSLVIQTSDDDWSTLEQFETMTSVLKQYEAQCTFYVVNRTVLTTDLMDRWERDGHVFSVHPSSIIDVESRPATDEAQRFWVPEMVRENVARHTEQFGRPVKTIRNHAIRWVGYMDLAYLHAELGIRGEANYFALGPILSGYLTGSGRLARFVDTDGTIIDHLQIASHWTEEILVSDAHGFSERWLYSRAREFTNGIINRSITRYHTPTVINSHPVSFATYSRPLIESNWQTAREGGVPIVNAETWVDFTDARRALSISTAANGYVVRAELPLPRVVVLLPEGVAATGATETIWGRSYTAVTLDDLAAGEERQLSA